jgi:PiT family inorganic phosphate transporter
LFGGLIGAVLVGAGAAGVNFSVIVSKILLPAIVAPLVAGVAAGLATFLLFRWFRHADKEPAAGWFRRAQTVSGSMIALAHGTSDGQKTMGVITLVLITAGYQDSGTGPQTWVIASAGLAIGLGTYSGGWRIMRTMGKGLTDLQPPQGFAAETTSAAAILASAHMGFGLSTTQVCSGSVIGSGAGRNLSAVRWGTARRMVYGWMLTLPAAALVGAMAAAIALTGPVGISIVLAALVVGSGAIVTISRRTAVTSHNVTESRNVTVQFSRAPASPIAAAAASASVRHAAIPPIIIRQPALPPSISETTTKEQQP